MEEILDDHLHIWKYMFGVPRSNSDINTMKSSQIIEKIGSGKFPSCAPDNLIINIIMLEWL